MISFAFKKLGLSLVRLEFEEAVCGVELELAYSLSLETFCFKFKILTLNN